MSTRAVALIAGTWAALALAADAGKAWRWEVPQPLESVPVPGPVEALGVPMRLHAVRSRMGMEDLFRYFLAEFQRADLYVPPAEGQFQVPGGLQLTGLDVGSHVSYTVIFQPNPDRTTTVILGEADLARRRAPESDRVGVPVFPGAKDVLQSTSESTTTVTYVALATPADLAAFYQRALGQAGFREAQGVFVKPGEEIQVLSQGEAGALFVSVIRRRQPLPPPPKSGSADAGQR